MVGDLGVRYVDVKRRISSLMPTGRHIGARASGCRPKHRTGGALSYCAAANSAV